MINTSASVLPCKAVKSLLRKIDFLVKYKMVQFNGESVSYAFGKNKSEISNQLIKLRNKKKMKESLF